MAGADEGSRIRDVVRGSKIRLDILRKLDRQLGSYKSELNQGTIEIQNCSEQFQCHGRVLPRSAKGVEDCTYVRRLGRNRSPTAGSERRSNLQEANRRWVRSYLPLFKRTSNKVDLFNWFDAVDHFFEETQPPETIKCELVSYVLEGEAERWWQNFQQQRLLDGESEIKLWPRMKFILSNDFWPARCSIKGSPEVENSSKVVNYGHNIPDEEESKAGCEYDAEAHNNNDEIAMEKTDKVTPTKCSTNYLSNIHLEKSVYMGSTELYNSVSDYSIRLTHGAEGCVKQVEEEKNISAEVKLTNSATRKAVYNDEADSELGSTGVPAIKIVLPSATIDAKQKVKSVEARIECNDSFDVHKTKVVVSERLDSAIEVKQRKGVAVVKHLKADRFMPTTCSTKFLNQLNIHGTNDGRLSKILIENFDPGGKWQCRLSVDDGQGQVLHHATPSSRDSNVYIKKEKQSRVLQAISRVIEGCDFEVCHQNFNSTEKWCMVSINNSTGAVKEGKCEENDQLVRLKRFFTCDEKSFGNETMFVCSIMFLGGFIALKFLSIQEHFVWRSATCLCSWPGSIHDNIVSRYELKSQKPTELLQFLFIDSAHLTLSKSVKMESIKSAFEFFGLPNSCGAIGATHTVMPLRETSVNCDDQDPTSYMFLCGNVDNEFRFLENINGWLRWMTITKPLSPRPLRFSSSDGSMIYASYFESRQCRKLAKGHTNVVTHLLCWGCCLSYVLLNHTLQVSSLKAARKKFINPRFAHEVVSKLGDLSLGKEFILGTMILHGERRIMVICLLEVLPCLLAFSNDYFSILDSEAMEPNFVISRSFISLYGGMKLEFIIPYENFIAQSFKWTTVMKLCLLSMKIILFDEADQMLAMEGWQPLNSELIFHILLSFDPGGIALSSKTWKPIPSIRKVHLFRCLFMYVAVPNGSLEEGFETISAPSIISQGGYMMNPFSMCFGHDGRRRINSGDTGRLDREKTSFSVNPLQPATHINLIFIDTTRGRVIRREGWNDEYHSNKEGKFIMTTPSVSTISSWLSILWDNGHFILPLRLFYKMVNGLDPPMELNGELGRPQCGSLRVRSWTSFSSRGIEMM